MIISYFREILSKHTENAGLFFLLKASVFYDRKGVTCIFIYSYSFICLTFIYFFIFHNRIIDYLTLHVNYVHDILNTVKLATFLNNLEKDLITEKTGFPIKFLRTNK